MSVLARRPPDLGTESRLGGHGDCGGAARGTDDGFAAPLGDTTDCDMTTPLPPSAARLRAAAGVLAAACALAALAPPAHGASIADRRLAAAQIERALESLGRQLEGANGRYQAAAARLERARAAAELNARLLDEARRSQTAAQQRLADLLVHAYKQGNADVAAYVLASGSFGELLSRVDTVGRLGSAEGELIAELRRTRAEIALRGARLRLSIDEARRAQAAAGAARLAIHARLVQRRRVLAAVRGEIARLVRAAERRRALAVRETAAQASPPPAPAPQEPPAAPRGVYYGSGSWYGPGFEGQPTASGEIFDPDALTAANPWLPFGTHVRVTDLANGRSVVVRINDRGPFGGGIIDVTPRSAHAIGLHGRTPVRLDVL
jgi:peptidoglycan hydrolase CwlO-like protein